MRRTIGLKRGKIPKRNSAKQKTPQRSTKRITPARKASDALKPDLY
jgi:hypothetical protein